MSLIAVVQADIETNNNSTDPRHFMQCQQRQSVAKCWCCLTSRQQMLPQVCRIIVLIKVPIRNSLFVLCQALWICGEAIHCEHH